MQYLKVKAHAGEKKNKLVEKSPDTYEIWVKAPADMTAKSLIKSK